MKHLGHQGAFESADHEKAWLIRVAINTCNDQHKKAHRNDIELPVSLAAVESQQPGNELSQVIDAMQLLPIDQRTALYLNAVQGYSADEVAKAMGSTPGTVYSWVSRARTQLKEALK